MTLIVPVDVEGDTAVLHPAIPQGVASAAPTPLAGKRLDFTSTVADLESLATVVAVVAKPLIEKLLAGRTFFLLIP